jgi:Tfp pilus assembly protein PilV
MRGAFLIEALVAVLVFSLAAAAVFSLLANALHASTNASIRAAASALAAATLAHMSIEDLAAIADRYDPDLPGPGYRTLATMAKRLPGVTDTHNRPLVTVSDGSSAASRRISITVFWQLPSEARPHRVQLASVVAHR